MAERIVRGPTRTDSQMADRTPRADLGRQARLESIAEECNLVGARPPSGGAVVLSRAWSGGGRNCEGPGVVTQRSGIATYTLAQAPVLRFLPSR